MKLLQVVFLTLISSLTLISQDSINSIIGQHDYAVYTFNDKIITGNDLNINAFNNRIYFQIGDTQLLSDKIKFFKANDAFFASTNRLDYSSRHFAKRTTSGKINIYEKEEISENTRMDYLAIHESTMFANIESNNNISLKKYYNKGYNNLKSLNIQNLKYDLSDNDESLALLNIYAKFNRRTKSLFMVGIGTGVVALAATANAFQGSSDQKTGDYLPAVTSLGLSLTSFYFSFNFAGKRDRYLDKAIEVYNK